MKDYGRRQYATRASYFDYMRQIPEKALFNEYLQQFPQFREFHKLEQTISSAELAFIKFLRHSEFKKPYLSNDYNEMEYLWTGFPGIPFYPRWYPFVYPDFSWPPPFIGGGGGRLPTFTICDAEVTGCFCPGETKQISVTATQPIYGVTVILGPGTISNPDGFGTNDVTFDLTTPASKHGIVKIEVSMTSFQGVSCSSAVSVSECNPDDCCNSALEWDWDNSIQTLVAPGNGPVVVKNGGGPYTWTVASEDGKWHLQFPKTSAPNNVLIADSGACGSATITVKDCENTVIGSVRNPANGSWQIVCQRDLPGDPECATLTGPYDTAIFGATYWEFWKTQGKYQTYQKLGTSSGGSYNANGYDTQEEACAACNSYRDGLTWSGGNGLGSYLDGPAEHGSHLICTGTYPYLRINNYDYATICDPCGWGGPVTKYQCAFYSYSRSTAHIEMDEWKC